MEDLKFTLKAIKKLEERHSIPLYKYIGDFSVSRVCELVELGLNLTPEQAEAKVDEYLAEPENDMVKLYKQILKKLDEQSFLDKTANISELLK